MQMKNFKLSDNTKTLIVKLLYVAAVGLVLLLVAQFAGTKQVNTKVPRPIATFFSSFDKHLAKSTGKDAKNKNQKKKYSYLIQAANSAKKRDPFYPPKEAVFKGGFTGVLGDKVITKDGKLVSIGDKVAEATVVDFGPHWVDYEFHGKTQTVWFWNDHKEKTGSFKPKEDPEKSDDKNKTSENKSKNDSDKK